MIIVLGSRGDVQPHIALAVGLKSAGHQVRIITHDCFGSMIKSYGLDFSPISGNPIEVAKTQQGIKIIETGKNWLSYINRLRRVAEPMLHDSLSTVYKHCQEADAIICVSLSSMIGYLAAAKFNKIFIMSHLQPAYKTSETPHFYFPQWRLGRYYNKLTHFTFRLLSGLSFRKIYYQLQKQILQLPPIKELQNWKTPPVPNLFACSAHVIKKTQDWSPHNHIIGYWFLDEQWSPPAALVEFIDSGPAPIYIGFGSMNAHDAKKTLAIIIDVIMHCHKRAILCKGWGQFHDDNLPSQILQIESAPHNWLFPKMSGIIHHGGAGTTAAGLRAGVPTVVVPFCGDQFFWGQHIHQLGVAAPPIPYKKLTRKRLLKAITAMDDEKIKTAAQHLAFKIHEEDGIAKAVEIIENCWKSHGANIS